MQVTTEAMDRLAEICRLADGYGCMWTTGGALHNRKAQVRFLSRLLRITLHIGASHTTPNLRALWHLS
jgi:hypothetical protein